MRCLLALVVFGAFVTPLGAAAADPPPLRSLVFDVAYTAHSKHEKKTSGFNAGSASNAMGSDAAGVGSGNGTAGVSLDGTDNGRLTVDVIAATKDSGLVVDVQYVAKLGSQPKMRVALLANGQLAADPTKTLDPAVVQVLPMLARGFIANRDVNPGSSWTVAAPPPLKGSTTYRVTALDGQYATLVLEGSRSLSGVTGFDESDRGTAKYATDLIVPVSYDVTSRIRRQISIDELITTDARLTVTLVSDTFTKK